jgi:hypothetical protein
VTIARTNGVSDSRAGWTIPLRQPEGQMFAVLNQRSKLKIMLLLLHRLEGLHQLHLVLPPEGIAFGHTRESRLGIRGDHNSGETMAPSGKDENHPSSVT